MKREQETVDSKQGTADRVSNQQPVLSELDKLKLERLNLSISNLNLQLALLNERARTLQIETAGFRAEREGLVKQIMESSDYAAGDMESTDCVSGKWKLNPDTMIFEAIEAELAPAQAEDAQ